MQEHIPEGPTALFQAMLFYTDHVAGLNQERESNPAISALSGQRIDHYAIPAHTPQYSPDDELPIPTARDHTLKKGDAIGSSQQSLNDITHYTTSHATLSTTTRNIFCDTSHDTPGDSTSPPGIYTHTRNKIVSCAILARLRAEMK